jgi:hypothetical protein
MPVVSGARVVIGFLSIACFDIQRTTQMTMVSFEDSDLQSSGFTVNEETDYIVVQTPKTMGDRSTVTTLPMAEIVSVVLNG